MNPYPQDPYGQPHPQSDPLYAAKRRMQGWWGVFAVTLVLGIVSAAYSATLVASDNPYSTAMQPTSLSYVLLAIGLVNGVVGTVALVIAIKATTDHSRIKRDTYGRY